MCFNGRHTWVFLLCWGFHTYESLLMLHIMIAERASGLSSLTGPVFKGDTYHSLYLRWWVTLCKVIRKVHYIASRMEKANFFIRLVLGNSTRVWSCSSSPWSVDFSTFTQINLWVSINKPAGEREKISVHILCGGVLVLPTWQQKHSPLLSDWLTQQSRAYWLHLWRLIMSLYVILALCCCVTCNFLVTLKFSVHLSVFCSNLQNFI